MARWPAGESAARSIFPEFLWHHWRVERHTRSIVVRADGLVMAYRRNGQGPVVVCLAGGPGAESEYLEDLGGLSRRHQLVMPDARGTGRSAPPETPAGYGFDRLADDIEPLREHLGLERVPLLAHSAACTTALVYAARHPSRIQALVLVTPSRWRLYEEIEDDTARILHERKAEPWYREVVEARVRLAAGANPDEVAGLVASIAPAGYARWGERERSHAAAARLVNLEATRWFWHADVDAHQTRRRLGLVSAPVLVVTGELDTQVGVNAGRAWAECFPGGRHVTIPHSGHNPWVDAPEAFAELVSGFLATGGD